VNDEDGVAGGGCAGQAVLRPRAAQGGSDERQPQQRLPEGGRDRGPGARIEYCYNCSLSPRANCA
jgi:hypothetical protein